MLYTPVWHVLRKLKLCIGTGNGFAMISFGDGEIGFLTHPDIERVEYMERNMSPEAYKVRRHTIELLPTADCIFVGMTMEDLTQEERDSIERQCTLKYYHSFPEVLSRYGASAVPLVFTLDRYTMVSSGVLFEQIAGARVLLIGGLATKAAENWLVCKDINQSRVTVSGTVPCSPEDAGWQPAMREVDAILSQALQSSWDVALVSTGICANYVCLKLKQEGRIAIDFGASMNRIAGAPPKGRIGLW